MLLDFAYYTDAVIIFYFLAVNICYILLLFYSVPDILEKYQEMAIADIGLFVGSKINPPVTVIISAFNEENCIINTVLSTLRSDYRNLQICIVNDGSTDKTLENLIAAFDFFQITSVIPQKIKTQGVVTGYYISETFPNLVLIDKQKSGKADSLNTAINASNTPFFITVDADTIIDPQAISILVYSTLSKPHTIAQGGSIYVLNGCKHENGALSDARLSFTPIIGLQACEYLRAFLFGRTGWRKFGGPLILSGAFTLLERQAVMDAGGYKIDSLGEDMEIILNMHEKMRSNHHPYHIGYTFAASAWTNVPEDTGALWRQRRRWHQGLIDSLISHNKLFFNPTYGPVGMFSYPFQFLVEFLGPFVELFGYITVCVFWYFGLLNAEFAILFFIASWGMATVLTLGSALISFLSFNKYKRATDLIKMLMFVTLENFGYRQMLVICRVVATLQYFLGDSKRKWGK